MELEANVFCHDLINPPAIDRGVDIHLELLNPNRIGFRKEGSVPSGTIYSIKIGDAGSAEADFDNMLLAFKLILPRVCVNTH